MPQTHHAHHAHANAVPQAAATVPPPLRQARHERDGHAFVLRWEPGGESMALEALVGWVADPALPFDFLDAAQLSHRVGCGLAAELAEAVADAGE